MGCPNFTTPSLRGVELGERGPAAKRGNAYLPRLARLLMQLHGSSQVSPQSALGNESVRARAHTSGVQAAVCFAGVAQLVEHLFCKQVVRGSSPLASSAVGPRVVATGGGARGFRVLTSFALRSDAHAQECVPLRSSRKPRQNAELRGRVIQERPLVAAAGVSLAAPSPKRSASSLLTDRETSESCPSGQREQAVNLPDLSYAGSNPALSTKRSRRSAGTNRGAVRSMVLGRGRGAMSAFAGVAQLVERQLSSRGELSSPPSEVNSDGAPLQVSGPQPQNSASMRLGLSSLAGVAQLVERQPSKLNVEGSSPFSRSQFFGSVSFLESTQAQTFGQTRVGSLVAGEAEPRTGAERTLVREHRKRRRPAFAGRLGATGCPS